MILQATLFLLFISLSGIVILKKIIIEKRLFTLIPAGMVWGVTIYIFILNFSSKLLPGRGGIMLATVLLMFLGLGFLVSHFKGFKPNIRIKLHNTVTLLIIVCLMLATFYFARLKMTAIFPAADSDMQWAYASTFARGNYPIKAPWQPDIDPNYHLGAYFLEGSILSLTKLPLITIHAILNTYFLLAGALFSLFIFWEYKYSFRNLWFILATVVFYISFGVLIFIFPIQYLLDNINLNNYLSAITTLPSISAKGTGGASLVDLNSLSFLPARSLGIGMAFLAFYLFSIPFKNHKLKILFLSLIFSTTALVEESIFLPMFLTLISVFILSLLPYIPKNDYLKNQRVTLLQIIIATIVISVLQGGFITGLIHQKESAFNIYLPYSQAFKDKLPILFASILPSSSTTFNLVLPGPLLMALLVLIYSYFKEKKLFVIALFSLISLFCFLSIESKYYPSNNIRFYNLAYITAGTGLIYSIGIFMKNKSILQNLLFFLFFCFVLAPSFIPEILTQSKEIGKARINNIRSQILTASYPTSPFEEMAEWAKINLPRNSRLVVVDTDQPSPKRSIQFEFKGLYTILGPKNIRVGRPEPGPEFFDLALSLNPSILKRTQTNYIYVESDSIAYQKLPQFRKDDLSNNNYFKILESKDIKNGQNKDAFYRIYQILPSYLDPISGGKEIKEGTLETLQKLINNKSSVYISNYGEPPLLSFWYRMALILSLKDKDIRRNLSQTDYMLIETSIPYKEGRLNQKYDFYILGPNDNPPFPSEIIWSNLYANCWKRFI